ncbi:MAG: signal peptidase II [Alphaproteobacteria bacterium]|jgi:signal peptidase II|nr:signal peptidase II [Alphaproteobacteria bacterium]MBT7941808.1 signal peptidase II [Alphaproteobacteria bacterium]
MTFSRHFKMGLIVSAVILSVDQLTKWWIISTVMQPPRVIEVTSFFNLVMGWNYGVSFGMLTSAPEIGAWILPVAIVAITAVLVVWLYRADQTQTAIGLGLIIGGAVGNLIDRVRFGAVADFLDVHAWGYHWPAFNAADSAITIGAVALILDSLFTKEEKS